MNEPDPVIVQAQRHEYLASEAYKLYMKLIFGPDASVASWESQSEHTRECWRSVLRWLSDVHDGHIKAINDEWKRLMRDLMAENIQQSATIRQYQTISRN